MTVDPDSPKQHLERSDFIKALVQRWPSPDAYSDRYRHPTPKTIVQFWHDHSRLPRDIEECIGSWTRWKSIGIEHRVFDEHAARTFIRFSLGKRFERAFDRCYHPAMQADYFRLCYLFAEGGCYIDADDVCIGDDILWLFECGRLKLQPLCYDTSSQAMVKPAVFLDGGSCDAAWIFYFNNNPLVASRRHPIIGHALDRATKILDVDGFAVLPEIQETTGPGNLSKSIFDFGTMPGNDIKDHLLILRDWESFAYSRWPLVHRGDSRNWRLSNQKQFARDG